MIEKREFERGVNAVKLALAFLTVVPIRFGGRVIADDDLADSRLAYPLVGLAIGLVLGGLSWALAAWAAPQGIAAFVVIAVGAALTGGLHLDGLADSADGLFLSGDRDRRLAVMRDPHVGSYGTTAVILVILGKYAVLSDLTGPGRGWALVIAAMVSRSLILVSAGLADYARRDGTGRILIATTALRDSYWAAAVALIASAVGGGMAGVAAASFALGWAWGMTRLAKARLGGVTGDTLGALVETGELLVLLTLGLLGPAH